MNLPSDCTLRAVKTALDPREITQPLAGCFAVVAGAQTYSRDILTSLPALRLIARSGVGYDAIDLDAATTLGIQVTTTPGLNSSVVAEHSIALMLAVLHRRNH